MKHWSAFARLELMNLFDFNILKYVKDPADKKRRMALLAAYVFVAIVLACYVGASSYALITLHAGRYVPSIFGLFASLIALFFAAFKAKSVIWREKDLDLLASLPVKPAPIVFARLLRSYAEGLIVTLLILLPCLVIFGIFERPAFSGFMAMFLAIFLLPILPTTLAAWIGMLFSAIIARNRHKVLTETLLAVITVVVMFLLGTLSSPSFGKITGNLSEAILETFQKMETSFPLFRAWTDVASGKNLPGLLFYGLASLLLMTLTLLFISKGFFSITARLYATGASREYHLSSLQAKSVMTALIKKEAGRYFSSGIYVSNTIVGPIMAILFAVSLGFFDPAGLLAGAGEIPVTLRFQNGIPFLLGMIFAIMSISASSVSMEGKNWWMMKVLPLTKKEILHAKLAFNLLFCAPFYVLTELILLFTVPAGILERLSLLLVPAELILFSVVYGLFLNLKLPKFNWETEVEVVKQSAATGLSMLGMFIALIPGMALCLLPESLAFPATLAAMLLIGALTLLLYKAALRSELP